MSEPTVGSKPHLTPEIETDDWSEDAEVARQLRRLSDGLALAADNIGDLTDDRRGGSAVLRVSEGLNQAAVAADQLALGVEDDIVRRKETARQMRADIAAQDAERDR